MMEYSQEQRRLILKSRHQMDQSWAAARDVVDAMPNEEIDQLYELMQLQSSPKNFARALLRNPRTCQMVHKFFCLGFGEAAIRNLSQEHEDADG